MIFLRHIRITSLGKTCSRTHPLLPQKSQSSTETSLPTKIRKESVTTLTILEGTTTNVVGVEGVEGAVADEVAEVAILTEHLTEDIVITTLNVIKIIIKDRITIRIVRTFEEMSAHLQITGVKIEAPLREILIRGAEQTTTHLQTLLEITETTEIATTARVVAIKDKI